MLDLKSFQIALLAWGCIFCLILYFVMIFNVALEKTKRHILGSLLLFSALYLATDCLAWYFRGMPGTLGYYGVRLSNGINFISDYLLIGSFHALTCCSLFYDDIASIKQSIFFTPEEEGPKVIFNQWRTEKNLYC